MSFKLDSEYHIYITFFSFMRKVHFLTVNDLSTAMLCIRLYLHTEVTIVCFQKVLTNNFSASYEGRNDEGVKVGLLAVVEN